MLLRSRRVGMNLLAVMRVALGDLSRVKRVVKHLGMVNGAPPFSELPQVIKGCSDLLIEVFFGWRGQHARGSVGLASLPGNITVEIEAAVSVHSLP